ncbi:hypothetical protein DSM104299_00862 [Baekduia alba]|uniref:hypothetical protein n=1 Tax=Baekduia alba TaxID=2997333 RepID=UPI0023408689|nr:hypothetical protein [Baekduia alba]WCB92173.1 hypothetical protein DSM104299_00862 [Baekduia alba]
MLPHARAPLGAVLIVAALVAAGCGSSSSGKDDKTSTSPAAAQTTTTPPAVAPAAQTGRRPTKAAYVRQADKVCREARDVSHSANAVVQKAFAANDLNKAAEAIDNYTPLFARHVDELKALRQPAGGGELLSGLIKVMDGQVQALRDEATALRQQDDATLQQIGKAQQTELQFAEELGKQYGFRVCGRA